MPLITTRGQLLSGSVPVSSCYSSQRTWKNREGGEDQDHLPVVSHPEQQGRFWEPPLQRQHETPRALPPHLHAAPVSVGQVLLSLEPIHEAAGQDSLAFWKINYFQNKKFVALYFWKTNMSLLIRTMCVCVFPVWTIMVCTTPHKWLLCQWITCTVLDHSHNCVWWHIIENLSSLISVVLHTSRMVWSWTGLLSWVCHEQCEESAALWHRSAWWMWWPGLHACANGLKDKSIKI